MQLQTLPDGGQINRSSITAMRLWAEILGVRQVEILVAVAAVGPSYWDVCSYLQEEFCFSSRNPKIDTPIASPEAVSLATCPLAA
jgi:hypothetical protein